jgi:hypothetical protein
MAQKIGIRNTAYHHNDTTYVKLRAMNPIVTVASAIVCPTSFTKPWSLTCRRSRFDWLSDVGKCPWSGLVHGCYTELVLLAFGQTLYRTLCSFNLRGWHPATDTTTLINVKIPLTAQKQRTARCSTNFLSLRLLFCELFSSTLVTKLFLTAIQNCHKMFRISIECQQCAEYRGDNRRCDEYNLRCNRTIVGTR